MSAAIQNVLLNTGQMRFGGGRLRLRTTLGSCVALTMWHPTLRIGGMCHYLLPAPAARSIASPSLPGLYATDAIDAFLREIRAAGTTPSQYIVKMFGGGHMFPELTPRAPCSEPCEANRRNSCRDVPCKNILSGMDLLAKAGFTVSAENIGGSGSRTVVFDVWSGDVWVRHVPLVEARSMEAQ